MPAPTELLAVLEIGLDRGQGDAHQVELRFTNPASEAEVSPVKGDVHFDLSTLLAQELNPMAYGSSLAKMLFADEGVRSMWGNTRASVGSLNAALRIRLLIGPSAPELHALRWELLADPEGQECLFTSERILFSRFMTSRDWRTVRLRPKADLTALLAVSAPSNAASYQLAEIDLDGEVARAKDNLAGIGVKVVSQPVTLTRLLDRLRDPIDILYLVCHGGLTGEGPHLFLQGDNGSVAIVKGEDFAARLADLPQQPRL